MGDERDEKTTRETERRTRVWGNVLVGYCALYVLLWTIVCGATVQHEITSFVPMILFGTLAPLASVVFLLFMMSRLVPGRRSQWPEFMALGGLFFLAALSLWVPVELVAAC